MKPAKTNYFDNPQKLKDIAVPHPHDILCGRGAGISSFVGNVRWRELISAKKEDYVLLHKLQRHILAQSIVNAVRCLEPPGRFLQRDPITGLWFDVGDEKAKEKTSQALREGAPLLRKKLKATSNGGKGITKPTNKVHGPRDTGPKCSDTHGTHGEKCEPLEVARAKDIPIEWTPLPLTPVEQAVAIRESQSSSSRYSPIAALERQRQCFSPISWQKGNTATYPWPSRQTVPSIPRSRQLQLVPPSRNVDSGILSHTDPHPQCYHHGRAAGQIDAGAPTFLARAEDVDPNTHQESREQR